MPRKAKTKEKKPIDPNTPLNKLGNPRGGRPKGSQTKQHIMIKTKSQRFIKLVYQNACDPNHPEQAKYATIAASLMPKNRSTFDTFTIGPLNGRSPKEYALKIAELMLTGVISCDMADSAIGVLTKISSLIDVKELEETIDQILQERERLSLVIDNTTNTGELLAATTVIKATNEIIQ